MKRVEIDRLPESITLDQARDLLRGLGLEPGDVISLHMHHRAIEVEILAMNSEGKWFHNGDEIATHSVTFQVRLQP